jgi:DnaJ domain
MFALRSKTQHQNPDTQSTYVQNHQSSYQNLNFPDSNFNNVKDFDFLGGTSPKHTKVNNPFFEMNDEIKPTLDRIEKVFEVAKRSQMTWWVTSTISNNNFRSSASSSVSRLVVDLLSLSSPELADFPIHYMKARKLGNQLVFFPTLIRQQGASITALSLPYQNLLISFEITQFLEEETPPSDAESVGEIWKYINKDGSPDRRYSSNRKIPIYKYGVINFISKDEKKCMFSWYLSNVPICKEVFFALSELIEPLADKSQQSTQEPPRSSSPKTDPLNSAFKTLGLQTTANLQEVVTAYHNHAKMNHPDKVNHLAPEFRELAEKRMKELNEAYTYLRQHLSS